MPRWPRLRTVSPVATSSRRARSVNAAAPALAEHVVRDAQLGARLQAAVLAAQPLAVEEVGAAEVDDDPRPREVLDRLAGRGASARSPSLSRARERASMPSAHSVPAAVRSLLEPRERLRSPRRVAAARAAASISSTRAKPVTPMSSNSHATRACVSASS